MKIENDNQIPCSECIHYASCTFWCMAEKGWGFDPGETYRGCRYVIPLSAIKFIDSVAEVKFMDEHSKARNWKALWYRHEDLDDDD